MRNLLALFLLLLFWPCFSQTDTTQYVFALDVIRTDSFFLNSTTIQRSSIEPRPMETLTPRLFRDTSEFSQYIRMVELEYNAISAQYAQLNNRKAQVAYHAERLKCLRDSVFYGIPCSGIGARMLAAPPPSDDLTIEPIPDPVTPAKKPSTNGKKDAANTPSRKKKNR
jgi:hypothetical protein